MNSKSPLGVDYKTLAIALTVIIVFGGLIASVFLFTKGPKDGSASIDASLGQDQKDLAMLTLLEKTFSFPAGDQPQIDTVTAVNIDMVKKNPIFADAAIDDKVLLYSISRRLILFRPSTQKIINVTTLPASQNSQTQQVVPETPDGVSVPDRTSSVTENSQMVQLVLYNGTKTNGLAGRFESDMRQKITDVQFQILEKANASGQYTQTQVIPLTKNGTLLADKIKAQFNAEKTTLPSTENKPDTADVLVILGSDYAASSNSLQPTVQSGP